jgi:hypothetical protein
VERANLRAGPGRGLLLWALVASLCVTAVIAIATLLFAEFDETTRRILGTTALLSLASLLALPAGVLLDRRTAVPLAWSTIAAAVVAFVLAMVAIWGARGEEWLSQLTWTCWLAAGAGAQACGVTSLLRSGDSRRIRILYGASIVLATLLAALIALAIWVEPESSTFVRVTGAVAVAAVLTSLLQPILRRVERPAERARLVLDLDTEPSEEAVDAAIEALTRHGVTARRG